MEIRNISRSEVFRLLSSGKAIRFYLSDGSSVGCYLSSEANKVHVSIKKPIDGTGWHEPVTEEFMYLNDASEWVSERDVEVE